MVNDVWTSIKQIYGSSVNGPVRHKCLSVIGKLMYYSPAEMIESLLSMTNIARYLICYPYISLDMLILGYYRLTTTIFSVFMDSSVS